MRSIWRIGDLRIREVARVGTIVRRWLRGDRQDGRQSAGSDESRSPRSRKKPPASSETPRRAVAQDRVMARTVGLVGRIGVGLGALGLGVGFLFGRAGVGPPMLKRGPPPPSPPLSSLVSLAFGLRRPPRPPSAVALFALAVGLGPLGLLAREADLALAAVDAEDLDLDLVADLDDLLGAVDLVVGQLGDVQQAFQARLELDEDAEVGQLGDLALDDVAGLVAAGDVGLPRVVAAAASGPGRSACAPGRR